MRVKDARQTFLGIWIRRLLDGEPFEVWGGDQKRDYTYVDDAVEAFLLAAGSDAADGRIFNLGGGVVVTLKETADALVAANRGGSYATKTFPKDRKRIDIGDYHADGSAIADALGWRPRVDLNQAFELTLTYYRKNLAHYVMDDTHDQTDRPEGVVRSPATGDRRGDPADDRQRLVPPGQAA
jgi:UDP-glucose 4-epimerase